MLTCSLLGDCINMGSRLVLFAVKVDFCWRTVILLLNLKLLTDEAEESRED